MSCSSITCRNPLDLRDLLQSSCEAPSFTPLTELCSILVFILTLLLLSADFYYLKNIAGRRLVGLRWWNEVNTASGDSHWVFESSDPNVRTITATDKRFFWLSLYLTPALWVGLAILAIVRLVGVIWLSLVGQFSLRPSKSWREVFILISAIQVSPSF